MENCFRFLINVDQCLNMSNFDIFFYRLQGHHKFRLNQVQLFGDSFGSSLRGAVTDIRMYMDKYPYHIGDCRIIVAMRGEMPSGKQPWQETMLYRVLQINHELKDARILINSKEKTEKVLNLVMLYDADFSAGQSEPEEYMSSGRLQADCGLLLEHLGADPGRLTEPAEGENPDADPAAYEMLTAFRTYQKNYKELLSQAESDCSEDTTPVCAFAMFVKEQLANAQVYEALIDRNNRRQNILGLLRLVEFISEEETAGPTVDGQQPQMTLAQRCAKHWSGIWADNQLEKRYATMLRAYQRRLLAAERTMESPLGACPGTQNLPKETIPADDAIAVKDGTFTETDESSRGQELLQILKKFMTGGSFVRNVRERWSSVYQDIRKTLDRMDHELRAYAEELSRQYGVILEERKKASLLQKTCVFKAEEDTEKNIGRMDDERDLRLQKLKNPQMNPSLSFQDQLNMENSLEQENLNITFYLRCLDAVRAGAFLLLIAVCTGLVVLHYSLLQPFVFQKGQSFLFYLLYIVLAVVLMLLGWGIPYRHFRMKLKNSLVRLELDMKKYISGYFEKAQQFCEYINLLNQLDFINRYQDLLVQAYVASNKLSKGYLWHKVQISDHLKKLKFFQGLIDTGEGAEDRDFRQDEIISVLDGPQVKDIVDSPIYWPQKNGEY